MPDAVQDPGAGPRLSIIISCFNYAAFVGRAIESVLLQNEPRCELLVVDDGSTDGSWDVIERYGLTKTFRLENGGQLNACRYGVAQSEAPFVLFLDSDDELVPGSLDRILRHLRPGLAKLQFPLTPIDAEGRVLGAPRPPLQAGSAGQRLRDEVLATGCYTSPPTSGNVFCRSLCALLSDVDYDRAVDGVILFAAPFFGDVLTLSEPLGLYRLHGRNDSQSGARPEPARLAVEAERFLVRHAHLRRVLSERGVGSALVDGPSAFFYRERRLYQDMLEGRRPRLGAVLGLQRQLVGMDRPVRYRISMSLLFWLLLLLPRGPREALVDYRFALGPRNAGGMLKAILRRGRALAPA